MTQEQLAERSDVAADTIRRLEKSDFSPSLRTLRKVCSGLGISLSSLFNGFEMPRKDPTLEQLHDLLQGCSTQTLNIVTGVVRELVRLLDERAQS